MNTSQTPLFWGLSLSLSIHGLLLLTPLVPAKSEHQNPAQKILNATIVERSSVQESRQEAIKSTQPTKRKYPSEKNRSPEHEPTAPSPRHSETVYYTPDQVTQTAEIVQQPEFPAAQLEGVQRGEIRLKILINEFGVADRVEVEAMTPRSVYGEEVASRFMDAQYKAATINSKHVKSWLIIEISYGE